MADLQNEFSVSKTRIENFNTCLRRFYYRHYGFWGGWDKNAPAWVRELYALTKLSSRPQWVGTVVHDAIDEVIAGLGTEHSQSVEQVVQRMKAKMHKQWEGSLQAMRSGQFRKDPKRVAEQTATLQEHFYEEFHLTQPEDLMFDIEQAERCLRDFYETSIYRQLVAQHEIEVIQLGEFPFTMINGVKTFVQIDLMYCPPGKKLVIVDWKTGRDFKPTEVFNQLFVYAVYAVQEGYAKIEDIWLCGVDLFAGQEHSRDFDKYWYEATIHSTSITAHEFKKHLVDPVANIAQIDDFPMTSNLRVCSCCPFRGPCGR